jgi:hypothetical protein
MPSATLRAVHGLNTSPNPYSAIPEGALLRGDEVVAREAGVLAPRRGLAPSVPFLADRCFSLPTTAKMLCTALGVPDPTIFDPDHNTSGAPARSSGLSSQLPAQAPYQTDPRVQIQGAASRGNLYFTTKYGISTMPGTWPQWRSAGLPRPYGFASIGTLGMLVLPNNVRRTYRLTVAMYDELGNFLEGPPSEPFWVENTSGSTASVSVSPSTPCGMPMNAFFRVYRALETPAGTPASDEMFLIGQTSPDSANYAPGYGGFRGSYIGTLPKDVTPTDSGGATFLSSPLYTNLRTGDGTGGIAGENQAPPAATTIAYFKGRMYFGRPSFRQSIQIQILGTGAGGLNAGDTITVDGQTWTAGTDFGVVTSGSVPFNIQATALLFTRVLNDSYVSSGGAKPLYNLSITRKLRAQYISSVGGTDYGRILIERIVPAPLVDDPGIAFAVSTQQGGSPAGTPCPGITFPNGALISTDSYAPGGVSWSKVGQPEAVPPINYQTVGDPTAAVLGFSVHRDVMFMWKEDGVWAVRDDGGPQPSFALLDASVNVLAPASIAVVDNIAYALTPRGVLQVSEQGTVPVGEPIRTDLLKQIALDPVAAAQAFAVGYDSERLYILGIGPTQYVLRVPDAGYPPSPPQWTRWRLPGVLFGTMIPIIPTSPHSNRLLFLYQKAQDGVGVIGAPTSGALVERKGSVGSLDYVDFIGTVANPATMTTNVLNFGHDVHREVFPGDVFTYNPAGAGAKVYTMRVTAVDNRGNVTLDASYPFTAGGTLTYYRGIQCRWRYAPIALGEPTAEKLFESVQLHFDYIDGDWSDVMIDSNKVPGFATRVPWSRVYTDPPVPNTSGDIATIPWLRNTRDVILRVDPGQAEARAARLGVEVIYAQALASFRLTALSVSAQETKTRATR